MYCKECGKKIGSGVKFCQFCGAPAGSEKAGAESAVTVRMTCRSCRASMEIVPGTREMVCPYCGARELIEDSDAIKKARINAELEKTRLETEERIETERLKNERLLKEKQMKNAAAKPVGTKLSTAMLILCVMMGIYSFSKGFLWPAVISVAQTVLFIFAILIAKGSVGSHPARSRIPRLIGLLLIIPFLISVNDADKYKTDHEKYTWPKTGMARLLPEPPVPYGSVDTNIQNRLRVKLRQVSAEDCDAYIDATVRAGFDQETKLSGSSYTAYNKEGYQLTIYCYSSLKQMEIMLYAPMELGSFAWPQIGPAALLPVPENDTGRLIRNTETYFSAYIGDMDSAGFEHYVDACREKGFTVDYEKTEDRYSAKNADGAELVISREGMREYEVVLRTDKK